MRKYTSGAYDLSYDEKHFLQLLSAALFKRNNNDVSFVLNDSMMEESIHQAVSAITYDYLTKDKKIQYSSDQKKVLDDWRKVANRVVANNIRIEYAHCELSELLSDNGIPHVILKGCASSAYYPDSTLRAMGDVDFLVRPEDKQRVSELLLTQGFNREHIGKTHHDEFSKDGIIYELHFAISGMPDGESKEILEEYLSNTIDTAKELCTSYGTMMIPDAFHHGMIILLHTARHITKSGMGLRHLCDWAVFVDAQNDFPEVFEHKLRRCGLWKFSCQLTALCSRFLGIEHKAWAGEWNEAFLIAMIKDIFNSGNMGDKRGDENQQWFTANVSSGGLSNKGMLSQAISSMNDIVTLHWKIVKYMPFLYPIGWIFFGFRYLIKIRKSKKSSVNLKKTMDEAAKRREIYREFGLFEVK